MYTILTVDDSEVVKKNLGKILDECSNASWSGHAYNVSEAEEHISQYRPNVVILDIQLKDETSFEFLKKLNDNLPKPVVIMLTNLSTEPYRNKCMQLGANYFLDKSSEFDKIPQILEGLSAS